MSEKQFDSVPNDKFGMAWFAVCKKGGKTEDVRLLLNEQGFEIDEETFRKRLPSKLQALANIVKPTGRYENVLNEKTGKTSKRMIPQSVTVITSKAKPSDYGEKGPRLSESVKSELASMFAEFE